MMKMADPLVSLGGIHTLTRTTLTDLDYDLAEVVWVPTPLEEANVAESSWLLTFRALLEAVLLNIADAFQHETDCEDYDPDNIRRFTKAWLTILENIRAVQERDWQTNSPDPKHLEYPEAKEGEELVSLVVEAIVLAGLQDAEEQEGG